MTVWSMVWNCDICWPEVVLHDVDYIFVEGLSWTLNIMRIDVFSSVQEFN